MKATQTMALADRYDLVERLGEGSFGEVFRAVDRISGRIVAIKVLHRHDDDARRRFHREAVALHSQLANEHVVTLLDHAGLNDDEPYLVLEFCELRSLRSWVGGRRGWLDIATCLLHAAKGLAGVHAAGGFHRDIKPENILRARVPGTPGWRVKLADFGFVGFPHPVTGNMTRSGRGTNGYIAPEIIAGAPFHAAADVYSLGIVAIELLVGRTDLVAFQASGGPKALTTLVRSMVAGLPHERPTAQEVVKRLEAVVEVQAAAATSPIQFAQQRILSAPAPRDGADGVDRGGGWGWLAALALGAVALGTMNTKDANGRFHGSDGKFRSGRWF